MEVTRDQTDDRIIPRGVNFSIDLHRMTPSKKDATPIVFSALRASTPK
jgi:hypothetical protein